MSLGPLRYSQFFDRFLFELAELMGPGVNSANGGVLARLTSRDPSALKWTDFYFPVVDLAPKFVDLRFSLGQQFQELLGCHWSFDYFAWCAVEFPFVRDLVAGLSSAAVEVVEGCRVVEAGMLKCAFVGGCLVCQDLVAIRATFVVTAKIDEEHADG